MQPVLTFRIQKQFAEAEAALRAALQAQGFGILTEVDVAATLKSKLGVDVPPQKLLGACNPKLAHAALQAEPKVGAFLPCGLSVRTGAGDTETFVDLQNPAMISELFEAEGVAEPAQAALAGITAALSWIGVPV